MAKISSLLLLVNSLSKGEKRSFKLLSALQDGQKDYLVLFALIEKGCKAEEIRNIFIKKRPKASYEATSKYLFKVITDCLLQLRSEQGKNTMLIISLLKANIMFEKSMYEEGFKQLQKVQVVAEEYEQYIIQLWAAKLELYYSCNLNFYQITEAQLIKKQMKIEDIIKYAKTIHQHTSLFELLRHRLLYKGGARTQHQKDELNDLILADINHTTGTFTETFESKKTHLLFQSHYFITISDYKTALTIFYELNELMENNRYLWIDSPFDYLSIIEGILDSLHTIKRYNEMDYFINKLEQLQKNSVYFECMVQRIIYIYKITAFLNNGNFDDAICLKNLFEGKLFKKIHLLDLTKQAEVFLYTALIYFGKGDAAKAHFYLNRILIESKLYHSLPVYRTFRLIHLLVHYELGNHDYIKYESSSIKRELNSSKSKSYLLEKIVFRFVNQAPKTKGTAANNLLWGKIRKDVDALQNNQFEIQIIKIFDFGTWIEAALCRKPFPDLLKEKHRSADAENSLTAHHPNL
jgi:hypothetical protein